MYIAANPRLQKDAEKRTITDFTIEGIRDADDIEADGNPLGYPELPSKQNETEHQEYEVT